MEDSCVLRGVMVNKDVTHPRMRRLIKNPRILLLDCSLEYKKGESQVHTHTWTHTTTACVCLCQMDIEISHKQDFSRMTSTLCVCVCVRALDGHRDHS